MGLFSTKKKRFVETSVVRVVEDEMIPNPLQEAMAEAIFGGKSVTESMMDRAANGRFRNFERMYRWAREPGNYSYGLPDVEVRSSDEGFTLAQQQMETEVGYPVTVEYLHFRPLNNVHAGYHWLQANWGYDEATNTFPSRGQPGTWYLEKMVALHDTGVGVEPEASALGVFGNSTQSGVTPERFNLDGVDAAVLGDLTVGQDIEIREGPEAVEIHWIRDLNGVITRGVETVDLSSYEEDGEYYQAKFSYTDSGSVEHTVWWIYDPVTGSNDALNRVFEPADYTNPGTYFPFAVFRSEQENRTADTATPEFQSTAKLLEFLDMDFKELGDSIHENPDIDDIRQAVMLLAVPITTDDEVQMEYLYRYFADLYGKLPTAATQRQSLSSLTNLTAAPDSSYALQISDADFSLSISFDKITRRLRAGSIGAVGTYTNNQESLNTLGSSVPGLNLTTTTPIVQNVRYFRKQITPQVYEEIAVKNPKFRYPVNKDFKKFVEGGADDERLLIPLDYNLCREMNVLKRGRLYNRSLNFVFNSYVVQKVKWYESGIFKALLVIVAVVITIATGPVGASLAAAAAAGATALTLFVGKLVIGYILKSVVFQAVFTRIVEEIGIEAAMILAVAAAFVGGAKALKAGEIVAKSTADNLLQVASGLVTGIGGATKKAFEALAKEAEAFAERSAEQLEELEEAQDLLGDPLNINPFLLIDNGPLVIFGESPENYFGRTVHSGNPGVASLNIIQNFVETSLRLPTIEDTLETR